MKKIRNEKGAITLFVLVSVLLFIILLMSTYTIIVNRASAQKRMQEEIAKTYGTQDAEEIYNSYFNTGEVIPIYNSYQLSKIASGDQIQINERNGQVYTFKPEYTYVLMNDIDVNAGKYTVAEDGTVTFNESATQWKPIIGKEGEPFSGTFDGLNHKISGIYINNTLDAQGLFGQNKGYIKNLKISNGKVTAKQYVGTVTGVNYGTIQNCSSNVNVQGETIIGGIVGLCNATDTALTDCFNYGTINGNSVAGGVVGSNKGNINNCTNFGKITVKTLQVGGIVGVNSGTVEESSNNSEVLAHRLAGGIVGYNYGYIKNCINEENGITKISANPEITDLSSYGAGGIAGRNEKSITECINNANIIGTTGSTQVGGIVGNCDLNSDVVVSKSYNIGNVQASGDNVGGIVGGAWQTSAPAKVTIEYCYNTGKVQSTGNNVGGIVGANRGIVKESYNTGIVEGKSKIAGIAGYVSYDGADNVLGKVLNCYSVGKINGEENIGGVVGAIININCEIDNSYYLTGTATGGINGADAVGQAEEKSATYMMSSNFVDELGNTNWKLVRSKNYPVLIWEKGEKYTNYTYVQDGLILWYDAIDNLGTGEHSTTTTTWKDLSGRKQNAKLIDFEYDNNSGWLNNGLICKGENNQFNTGEVNLPQNSDLTVSVTFTENEFINYIQSKNNHYILGANVGWDAFGFHTWYTDSTTKLLNGSLYIGGNFNSSSSDRFTPGVMNGYKTNVGKTDNITYTYNGETKEAKLYINANLIATMTYTAEPSEITSFISGISNQKTYRSILIYNKFLTQEEITQNYNVDKTRYGL